MAVESTAAFPADVVGVIADYACENAREALIVARVANAWQQGVHSEDELWNRLTASVWGGRKRRGGLAVYRARAIASLAYKPLEQQELHAIENCDFTFKCPLVAESLKPTGREAPNSGNPILHCNVCNEDVYIVSSQEELDQRRSERRCVAMKVSDLATVNDGGTCPITLCAEDPVVAQSVLATLKRQKRCSFDDKSLYYSINFTGMEIGRDSDGDALIKLTVIDPNSDSSSQTSSPTFRKVRPSYVFYQGQRPSEEITRGIPSDLIIEMKDVNATVGRLSGIVDECVAIHLTEDSFLAGDIEPDFD